MMIPWLLSKVPLHLLEKKGSNKIEVAFDEMLTNIYEHGYKTHAYPIFLKVSSNLDSVDFEIRDMGPKFNLMNHKSLSQNDDMAIGGLGITFIKAVFKNMNYEYKDGFNITKFTL